MTHTGNYLFHRGSALLVFALLLGSLLGGSLGLSTHAAADTTGWIIAQDGHGTIYTSSAAGPAKLALATTNNAAAPAESVFPTYALNHTKIFFVHETTAHVLQLHSMNPDGSDVVVVSTLPDQNYPFSMQWSEAAQRFVITDAFSQAYTITAQGTGYSRVFSGVAYQAEWSPNGQQIAFEAKSGVYIKNADGNDQRFVPNTDTCKTTTNKDLSWADASILLVSCTDGAGVSKILYYYLPNNAETTLLQSTTTTFDYLSVSPNGAKLAYETNGLIDKGASGETIWELDLLQQSLQKPTPTRMYAVSRPTSQDHFPLGAIIAWSPDSSHLAFTGPNFEPPVVRVTDEFGSADHVILSATSENDPIIALSW